MQRHGPCSCCRHPFVWNGRQSLLAGEALREALRAAGDAERDLDLLAAGLRERLAGERLRLTGLRLLHVTTYASLSPRYEASWNAAAQETRSGLMLPPVPSLRHRVTRPVAGTPQDALRGPLMSGASGILSVARQHLEAGVRERERLSRRGLRDRERLYDLQRQRGEAIRRQ